MKTVFAAGLLLLAGCASTSATYGPDGRKGILLNCSGLARSWNMCLKAAGDTCGAAGYDILAVNGDQGAVATFNSDGGMFASTISRSLMVACKK